MKIGSLAKLSLVVLPLLAGCGNFWQPPSGTTTTTCTTNCTSGYFYVLNQKTDQVIAYDIASSKLNPVGTTTLAVAPYTIAIAPNKNFLYVGTASGIYLFNIASGVLTVASTTAFNPDIPGSMAIDPTGAWLVEALPSSNSVVLQATPISTVGASTASTTTPIETAPLTGTTVKQIAFSPDGKNIFLALGDGGFAVVPFTVANTTSTPFGTAVYKGVYASGGAAVSIAVDPKSRLYYVGEVAALSGTSNTGGLRVFSYSALPTITEITTTPLSSGGLAPSAILPESSGAYVYVANGNGTSAGSISVFDFSSSGTTYSLTTTSLSTATGITPAGLAEESSNTYLLLVDSSGGPDLNAFTFSSSTGALTSAFTSTTGTDPVEAVAITATP